MYLHIRGIIILVLSCCASALIIPEEFVSFLSVVYSNIPPIRKGTDSRVGVGFRLGNNADFQFIVELGPQINTQPLGPQRNSSDGDSGSTTFKRHVEPTLALTKGSNWLTKWRANIERRTAAEALSTQSSDETPKPQSVDYSNRIINEPMILHLRKLYRGDGDPDTNKATSSNIVGPPHRTQTSKDFDKGIDDV